MIEGYTQRPGGESGEASVQEETHRLKEQAIRTGGSIAAEMQEKACRLATEQKDRAAERIGAVGAALHEAASRLHDDQLLSRYADQAGSRLEHWSHELHEQDLASLADRVEGFAKRRPELFLAGAFLTGVLLARLLKSTPEPGTP